jgi:hypothetical protein
VGLFDGQNLNDAFRGSFKGIGTSMAIGEALGIASTAATCYDNKVNPWTGTKIQSTSTPTTPNVQYGNNDNQEYHTFRHTDEMGLNRIDVKAAVNTDIKAKIDFINQGTPCNQVVIVNGQKIQYTAYKLPDGTINIGRIHAVK